MPPDRDWHQIGQGSEPWCHAPIVKFLAVSTLPITSVFNDGYIAEQYEAFRRNPDSVDEGWRQFFRFAATLPGGSGGRVLAPHPLPLPPAPPPFPSPLPRFR